MSKIKNLLTERRTQYGPSWGVHGETQKPIVPLVAEFSKNYPRIVWPWHACWNKLLRILSSPLKKDHWIDIQGYAQLVIDMIDELEGGDDKKSEQERVIF